jgi:hypothetical protein
MGDHINTRVRNTPFTRRLKPNSVGYTKNHIEHPAVGKTQHTPTDMGGEKSGHAALNTYEKVVEALSAYGPKVWVAALPTAGRLGKPLGHLCMAYPL